MNFEIIQSLSDVKQESYCYILPVIKGRFPKIVLSSYFPGSPVRFEQVEEDFHGEIEEVFPLYFTYREKQVKLFLLGLGKSANFASCFRSFKSLSAKHGSKLSEATVFGLDHLEGLTIERLISCYEGASNGLELGHYNIATYKSDTRNGRPVEQNYLVLSHTTVGDEIQQALLRGIQTATTQESIQDLVNAPSNFKTPEYIASWAKASAEAHGYHVHILDETALEKQHFNALLAVSQGSGNPPRFIHARYLPETSGETTQLKVALVGKGVTFDTGGLSIKPSRNMHYMKSDMGGAAAVLGAIELAAKLQLPIEVHALVPLTENCVDAKSVKPGDIIYAYNGKSIEIIDTDAEGRLILADALSYTVSEVKPDYIIDLATLTGSSVRTLGTEAAALFTHDDHMAENLSRAGEAFGERVWRLPLWEEYFELLRSEIADIRNLSLKPFAGAITAAKFLEYFTGEHPHWAHLDIAGVAFKNQVGIKQYSATAYGVRLLIEFLKRMQDNPVS